MNDDELARLARATWNQDPPDNLERVLEEAARRHHLELPTAAIEPSQGHVAPHQAPPPQPADADFMDFYGNVAPRLTALLWLRGAWSDEAADIAQEVMLAAYQQWATLERPQAWTFKAALESLLRRRPSLGRQWRGGWELRARRSQGTADDTPARSTNEARRLLATLRPRQREVLVLRIAAGLFPEEIAEVLDISPGTVKRHLRDGRETLRVIERLLEAKTDNEPWTTQEKRRRAAPPPR